MCRARSRFPFFCVSVLGCNGIHAPAQHVLNDNSRERARERENEKFVITLIRIFMFVYFPGIFIPIVCESPAKRGLLREYNLILSFYSYNYHKSHFSHGISPIFFFPQNNGEIDLRVLIHQSLAGCVIGKGGSKIKEIRDVSTRTNKQTNKSMLALRLFAWFFAPRAPSEAIKTEQQSSFETKKRQNVNLVFIWSINRF